MLVGTYPLCSRQEYKQRSRGKREKKDYFKNSYARRRQGQTSIEWQALATIGSLGMDVGMVLEKCLDIDVMTETRLDIDVLPTNTVLVQIWT